MKIKSTKLNYIYHLSYQILLIILPIVTAPYVSRVLLPEGVGDYSLAFSFITYFTLFASLGFTYYAQREIAKWQDNPLMQTRVFWEIILCRLIPVFVSLLLNNVLIYLDLYGEITPLMRLLNINIISIAFDIVFFFQGNEDFGKTTLVNITVKLLGVAGIFIFVKTPDDVWLYTLLNSLVLIVSNLSLWFFALPHLRRPKDDNGKRMPLHLHPFAHLWPSFRLFVPNIAISLYTILDKTLIGVITADSAQNGYYEEAEKIVKCAMPVVTALGTVMIPRNSREAAIGNMEAVKKNIYQSSHFVFFLGLPITVGFVLVASNLIPWFLGDAYEESIYLLQLFAPLTLIIGLSNLFGLQYLIPCKKDKLFTAAILAGAITNLVLNIPFITWYQARGAVFASLISESVVTLTMLFFVRKELSCFQTFKSVVKPFLACALMFAACYPLSKALPSSILNTLILVGVGVLVYGVSVLLLRDSLAWGILRKVKEKLSRK
ncbi:MAG: flippase [Clostridia bacterium]|nr:flippase [Clostridia bacterium]